MRVVPEVIKVDQDSLQDILERLEAIADDVEAMSRDNQSGMRDDLCVLKQGVIAQFFTVESLLAVLRGEARNQGV